VDGRFTRSFFAPAVQPEEPRMSTQRMNKNTPMSERAVQDMMAWRLFKWSFFPVLILYPVLPFSRPACGHYPVVAVALGISCAVACSVAFILCPRRCWLPKFLTFLLLWPGIGLGLSVLEGPFANMLASNHKLNRALTAAILEHH
jgi:hypothetical protein